MSVDRPPILALYLHVPFCFHKCHYCDFYSLVDDRDRQAVFVRRLIAELEFQRRRFELVPRTVFVGGGTPTLLSPALWQELLAALHREGTMDPVVEFTVEANPETVTPDLADVLVAGGVNRVSLGSQSFDPDLLKTLERWHDPARVRQAVSTLRRAGIGNVNLDLIFAIPGQTLELLDRDLDEALALGPEHLSCYNLTYEPNTALTQRLKLGRVQRLPEEMEAAMYQRVMDRLAGAGFEHYEISNWARICPVSHVPCPVSKRTATGTLLDTGHETRGPRDTGQFFRCQHNLAYWHNLNWLGLGPSAASHVDGRRWKNVPHLGKYLGNFTPDADPVSAPEPPTTDHEELPPGRRVGEELMLRLRLIDGVELTWLERALPAGDPRHAIISELVALGMLQRTPTRLRLTHRGLFVADAVVAKLL